MTKMIRTNSGHEVEEKVTEEQAGALLIAMGEGLILGMTPNATSKEIAKQNEAWVIGKLVDNSNGGITKEQAEEIFLRVTVDIDLNHNPDLDAIRKENENGGMPADLGKLLGLIMGGPGDDPDGKDGGPAEDEGTFQEAVDNTRLN